MSKADLSRLIVDAVTATLKVQAPELAPVGIEEAQRITGLSRSSLYKMTSANQIPHYKFGKHVKFDRGELIKFMKAQPIKTADTIATNAATRTILS